MPAADVLPEKLLSDQDVAKLFCVRVLTVRRWLKEGVLPPPLSIKNRRYWNPNDLAQFCRRDVAADTKGKGG